MMMAQLTGRNSLRDIAGNISLQSHRLYHLGVAKMTRSNLSRINNDKPYALYQALFGKLLSRCQGFAPKHEFRFKNRLYTECVHHRYVSVRVSMGKFPDHQGSSKAPCGIEPFRLFAKFVSVTEGKQRDVTAGRTLHFPEDSIIAIDKADNDYDWYNQLTERGIFFVTRL